MSNKDIDWAKHYDFYEIEMREMYRTVSRPQNDSHFLMLQKHLNGFLNHDKVFAEIGFSAGLTLRYAANYFEKVYGLDISPKNVEFTRLEINKEGYTNIELSVLDILERNEEYKKKFDVISFIHGIEHFSNEDYPLLFDNIRYYLKDGGVFTGALPNNLHKSYRMCPNCDHVFEIDGHLSSHTVKSLEKLFADQDFEVLYLSDFNPQHLKQRRGTLAMLYLASTRFFFNKYNKGQLEYIVRPK